MLQELRKLQAKTRQAFLLINRIEDMEAQIKVLLKDEEEDVKGYEGALKKTVKGKPNHIQFESQKIIDEINKLKAGKLKRYLTDATKNTTKSKK